MDLDLRPSWAKVRGGPTPLWVMPPDVVAGAGLSFSVGTGATVVGPLPWTVNAIDALALVGSSCICDTPWAVSHSLSHTRPGYPGCVDVYAKEDPSSPPSMALSVLWRVQGFTFSAVSAETKKKAERRPEALQKEDHTTPCPDQAGV